MENLENIDINNLKFVAKVGDDFIDLPEQSIDITEVVTESLQTSTLNLVNDNVNKDNNIADNNLINSSCSNNANLQDTNDGTAMPLTQASIPDEAPYYGDLRHNKTRQNRVTKNPSGYARNANKVLRMKGEAYLGYRRDRKAKKGEKFRAEQDVCKPARIMGSPCTSAFCEKSKLRACADITDEQRQHLFDSFWQNMNWDQRRAFICSHVVAVQKHVTKNPQSKRTATLTYFLTVENMRFQVCKQMFLGTFGIKDWFIRYWLAKSDCAMPPSSCNLNSNKGGRKKIDEQEFVETFLARLPRMPSHYCRASTSREYLEPVFKSMSELYKQYSNTCELEGKKAIGRRLFDDIVLKNNLSLFRPKKDQCDVCCSHKTGNIPDPQYAQHVLSKDRARQEKNSDKAEALSGNCHVFTQDVESVKLVPYLQASAIYYKTKLCVHNFTLYNLATKEVMCYWFDESNSTLEASVFASCIIDHLEKVLSRKLLPVILYSDGCCAQNRNATLSNALLRFSIEKNIVITQKYLEKGHTQMECDSVHSAIECKVKGQEIYLPQQYVTISKTARTDPMPYDATYLDYTFFTDFSKGLIYKSIRPGRKPGEPAVTHLRMLEYRPDGTIWFKTDFDNDLQLLPQRPAPIKGIESISQLPKLYNARTPITKRKYQDLQDLKAVIPSSCHSFFDELPNK